DFNALGLLLAVGGFRVVEPGIDVDPLSVRAVDAEGGVAEPGDGNIRHSYSSSLSGARVTNHAGDLRRPTNRPGSIDWPRSPSYSQRPSPTISALTRSPSISCSSPCP